MEGLAGNHRFSENQQGDCSVVLVEFSTNDFGAQEQLGWLQNLCISFKQEGGRISIHYCGWANHRDYSHSYVAGSKAQQLGDSEARQPLLPNRKIYMKEPSAHFCSRQGRRVASSSRGVLSCGVTRAISRQWVTQASSERTGMH